MRSITFIRKNLILFSKAHSGLWTGIYQTQGAQWTIAAARAGWPLDRHLSDSEPSGPQQQPGQAGSCSHHLPAFTASSAGQSADSPDGLHFHRQLKGLMGERTPAEGTEVPCRVSGQKLAAGSLPCLLCQNKHPHLHDDLFCSCFCPCFALSFLFFQSSGGWGGD